jgi:hypothetical protein
VSLESGLTSFMDDSPAPTENLWGLISPFLREQRVPKAVDPSFRTVQ